MSETGAKMEQAGTSGVKLSIALAFALLLVACGLLWARFGTQVFLDAALSAWKTCF